jgi:SAM-dependent methyltransferase
MRSSVALFDSLAAGYDDHFQSSHRRAYDDLAWERVTALLPPPPELVIDAGCGVGRWARRLVGLGYRVIGLEQAPAMVLELRRRPIGDRFRLVEGPMETAALPHPQAGMALAMGSLQYTADPAAMLARMAGWVRPGGVVCVLVDSLVALILELLREGRTEEALERLRSRRGLWVQGSHAADLHLFDRAGLEHVMAAAELESVRVAGLLVSATAIGRDPLAARLAADPAGQLALERALAADPAMADAGKQLFASGRRPAGGSEWCVSPK